MVAEAHTSVQDLEREIDEILEKSTSPDKKVVRRKLALTDENVRRLFGFSRWELFRELAAQFGYVLEDEGTEKTK